jgi:isoquinoline 1-oxidoreductase beta subunit
MSQIENVSRRSFLKGVFGTGALILAVRYLPPMLRHGHGKDGQTDADRATFHPNLFVGIQQDGTVYIVAHRSEMGTTIRTSLPLVLADELDADWKRVKIDQAIGDKRYGDQNTDGSQSVRRFYDTMRECGAAARWMLIQAAALQWNAPASECSAEMHAVVHKATGRRVDYGEVASAAARLTLPKKEQLQLKEPSERRYIGKGMTSVDLEKLCTGKAMYGMDARVEGMVYASIEHPPVFGGKINTLDDEEALKVAAVHQTVRIDPFSEATRAQFEGAVVFGTSIVRSGEITAKNGAIQQSNFNDYPVARINEVPAQTNVYITESSAPPAGVGEPGVPPFVAAFCNAIFAATGKRVRDLPLSSNNLFG